MQLGALDGVLDPVHPVRLDAPVDVQDRVHHVQLGAPGDVQLALDVHGPVADVQLALALALGLDEGDDRLAAGEGAVSMQNLDALALFEDAAVDGGLERAFAAAAVADCFGIRNMKNYDKSMN